MRFSFATTGKLVFQELLNHFFGHLFSRKALNVGVPLKSQMGPLRRRVKPACWPAYTKGLKQQQQTRNNFVFCLGGSVGGFIQIKALTWN